VHSGSFPFHSISFRRDTFVLTTWTCDRQRPDFSADLVDGDDGAFLIKQSVRYAIAILRSHGQALIQAFMSSRLYQWFPSKS
jgi:hypothetical protein